MDAFPGASPPALTLFVAVHRSAVRACEANGKLERCSLGGKPYIGLRETGDAAMERAKRVFLPADVNKDTYVILRLSLSAEAVARFTAAPAGVEHQFASMLHRRTYCDETDWGVWHFCGDFPLRFPGVQADWLEIE